MGIYKIIGAAGLSVICIGLLLKKRLRQDVFYIAGGVGLEVYSISIKDPIFIILELAFIVSAVYDFVQQRAGAKRLKSIS